MTLGCEREKDVLMILNLMLRTTELFEEWQYGDCIKRGQEWIWGVQWMISSPDKKYNGLDLGGDGGEGQ